MMRWGVMGMALAIAACDPASATNDASVLPDAASAPDVGTSDGGRDAGASDGGTDARASDAGTDAANGADAGDGGTDASTGASCACTLGATCLQANAASGCAAVVSSCSGGTTSASCDASDVEATCTRASSTTYYGWARVDGRLSSARTACTSGTGPGTFTVATIPNATGAVCSCQRSAAACVETHGASCATLACTAGATTTACDPTGAVPGRCVSRDGQTEIVYHGITPALAESTCHGASTSGELYWFP